MFHSTIKLKYRYLKFSNLYKFNFKSFTIQNNEYVVNLKSELDFEKEVMKCPIPVLIDFYADWCAPCRKSAPVLESKANDLKTFKLVKVNVDNHPELSERFEVGGIPYFVLMNNGRKIGDLVGFNETKLDSMLTGI